MREQGFDLAVSRLAQYRPFSNEGANLRAALRDLVLAAGAEIGTGGVFATLETVQRAFKTLWRLDIELDEVQAARDFLVAEGKARIIDDGFALTADALSDLEAVRQESEDIREAAFGEWAEEVRLQRPNLTDSEFESLVNDLEAWLSRVVSRHGVEAALVLYPENPRAKSIFQQIEEGGFVALPAGCPAVDSIREPALESFVKQPSPAQRTYLADRLNTSYFLTVLSLDPAAGELVQERLKGQRVYLDTNVLYAVIGLAKPQEAVSALRLLDLTQTLGYEVAITPWTLTELRTSLDRARSRIERSPLPRRELAPLLAINSDDAVVAAFWRIHRDRGTKPRDFFDYYGPLETLLHGHGIHVRDDAVDEIDSDRAAIDEQIALLVRQLDDPDSIPEPVLEHDVKHRLLIEHLRGATTRRFTDARCWFLTRDGKLPPYALTTADDTQVRLPFCVATSAWLQVMRSFVPRTDDLDRTVVDLLASQYIQMRSRLRPEIVDEVVARVDQFAQTDAHLASEVLADTALVADIEQATDSDDRRRRVDRAVEQKSIELEQTLDVIAGATNDHLAAIAAKRDAEAHAELERVQLRILDTELERERKARADSERDLAERMRRGEEALRRELVAFKQQIGQTVLAATIVVSAVAVATTLLATGTLTAPGLIVATVTATITTILLALRLVLGARRGDVIATWITIVLTIAGFVWFVIDEKRATPSSGSEQHTSK